MSDIEKQYKVSVLIWVSENSPDDLSTTLFSIKEQTMSTEEIQVVVVDNTSNGEYSQTCAQFSGFTEYYTYPNQYIVDIKNIMLNKLCGECVHIIQAGTKHTPGCFERAANHLKKEVNQIDFVAVETNFYGLVQSKDPLERGRFKQDGIIDLNISHSLAELYLGSVFIKREALFSEEGVAKMSFRKDIPFYEVESTFLLELTMRKKCYGIIRNETISKNAYPESLPNNTKYVHMTEWYIPFFKQFAIPLLKKSREMSENNRYIQLIMYYLLSLRLIQNLNNKNKQVLKGDDIDLFFQYMKEMLGYIDDDIILNTVGYKIIRMTKGMCTNLLRYKVDYNDDEFKFIEYKRSLLYIYKNYVIAPLEKNTVKIRTMEQKRGNLIIKGVIDFVFPSEQLDISLVVNSKKEYSLKYVEDYALIKLFGRAVYKNKRFEVEVPLDKSVKSIGFLLKLNGKRYNFNLAFYTSNSKLSNSHARTYWQVDRFLLRYQKKRKKIEVKPYGRKRHLIYEAALLKGMWSSKQCNMGMIALRILYWLTYKHFNRKRVWITYDKLYKAGDCGEYFARYVSHQNNKDIKMCYLINKDSSDYRRLKREGLCLLKPNSLMHKLHFLHADTIFFTHAYVYNFNGFPAAKSHFFRGLLSFKTMCIQHGLTVQKFAHSMGKYLDNTDLYFCASKYEIENLIRPIYGYNLNQLKLTGIPRYDGLINNDKRQILITPTWRMTLAKPSIMGKPRPYNPLFKESTYFARYNELVNNEVLINTAKKYNYSIIYLVHPTVSIQADDFDKNEYVEIIPAANGDVNYEKLLTESSLMVTDYSGVQFDFAYMRKPIVYSHYSDVPAYYEESNYKYNTMAFGELCTTNEELVRTICTYIENGCKMKPEYVDRANDFFAFDDHNNCKRIYEIAEKHTRK